MSHSGSHDVHVGSPAAKFPMEDVKLVHFHDFKNLTTMRGEAVESPEFECAGHKWKLHLYPGGRDDCTPGYMSVKLLASLPSESSEIKVKDYMVNVKKIDGGNYQNDWGHDTYDIYDDDDHMVFSSDDSHCVLRDFIKLSEVLDDDSEILHFGSLTLEVRMRPHPATIALLTNNQPL